MSDISHKDILDFWFKEIKPEQWFATDPALDNLVRVRFETIWRAGRTDQFSTWEKERDGALALIVLFDQFPRNMFRGTADAFSTDSLALAVAKRSLERNLDLEFPASVRSFFYLPFMHSELMADQEKCVTLTRERLGESHFSYPFALRHREAIKRFGRFPARNLSLGRVSTAVETEFLHSHPSGF